MRRSQLEMGGSRWRHRALFQDMLSRNLESRGWGSGTAPLEGLSKYFRWSRSSDRGVCVS